MEPAQRRGSAAATTTLEGALERIVFFDEDNGYAVARLQAAGHRDLVTIVGNMPLPNPGETLRLTGEWTTDPKFGQQFRVSSCLSVLPSTLTGIQKYLGSGLVRGIGPVMAERIVEMFGIETFHCWDSLPRWATERGIRRSIVSAPEGNLSGRRTLTYAAPEGDQHGPSSAALVLDFILFFISIKTFHREEILTKWT